MGEESDNFILNTSDSNFVQRQKNVFDQLKVIENSRKNISSAESMDVDEKPKSQRVSRSVTKHFRGKESIFKKPQHPVPKNYINKIPDFKKHPHKWTKYSLDDVKDEDISDRSNTRAALSFLNELKNRKNSDEGTESLVEPKKIFFQKYTKIQKSEPDEDKPTFHSSKIVMPEYVVGQKQLKEKKNKILKSQKTKELKLDHLFQNEDE